MALAHRHFVSGQIYQITRRCHKREFLLKYAKDRQWLFEAKKGFALVIVNYAVTSNHIHLLAYDSCDKDVIPRSMQLFEVQKVDIDHENTYSWDDSDAISMR